MIEEAPFGKRNLLVSVLRGTAASTDEMWVFSSAHESAIGDKARGWELMGLLLGEPG